MSVPTTVLTGGHSEVSSKASWLPREPRPERGRTPALPLLQLHQNLPKPASNQDLKLFATRRRALQRPRFSKPAVRPAEQSSRRRDLQIPHGLLLLSVLHSISPGERDTRSHRGLWPPTTTVSLSLTRTTRTVPTLLTTVTPVKRILRTYRMSLGWTLILQSLQ